MAELRRSYVKIAVAARKNPMSMLFITVMGTFTVATPSPIILGVPRPFLIALVFAAYMYFSLRANVGLRYWQFALAYLAAFIPATIYNFDLMKIKWTSVLELLPMLVTFCILAAYFERWLSRNSDREKARWIELVLVYFLIVSVLEMIFSTQFEALRNALYPSVNGDLYTMLDSQREMNDYGTRPSAFFSEPSNYAKFLSVIIATYMTVTKCSKRSIFALVVFYLLVRSVSYFYAAPLMAFAWWVSSSFRGKKRVQRRLPRIGGPRLLILGSVAVLLVIGVVATQQERIADALSGKDNSLNGRIGLPLKFMFSNTDKVLAGYGITPQADIIQYTVMAYAASSGNLSSLTGSMAATSTTITFLIGVGFGGLVVFYGFLFLMQRSKGLWIGTIFLVSNIINAGYNSSTTFVPSALLVGLLTYQLTVLKGAQAKQSRAVVKSLPTQKYVPGLRPDKLLS